MKKLGFGLMRLPRKDGKIDIEQVAALADEFLAKGYTYFDTAYAYGGSEEAFREAVVKRHPRESFTIASKMAGWTLGGDLTPEKMFNTSLERCGIEYFDYYLLHSLQESRDDAYEKNGCWEFCRKMKEEGKIRNLGFSYHGDPVYLEELLKKNPDVDFVQLQINYVDWGNNMIYSRENYEVCRKYGKKIVVMEPVKGGMLASMQPELEAKFKALDADASPAAFALRYAGSLEGVMVVLSGMNTMEQMTENTKIFDDFKPINAAEEAVIEEVKSALLAADTIPCTSCAYCRPGCPMNINIPEIFKAENMLITFGPHDRPHFHYDGVLSLGSGRASDCIGCGQCESVCPQHINIIERLSKASEHLDV